VSESPDTFAAVTALIALVVDVKACAKRLEELRLAVEAAEKERAQLAADWASHQRTTSDARAELEDKAASLRKREVAVAIKERDLVERERVIAASKPDRYPPDPNFHGTIRQEPYTNG
jgi:hypothetical protein